MKISVDGQDLFALSETQKKVLCNELSGVELDQDLKRRLEWVIMHKYHQCLTRLKKEWEPKLKANGLKSIPLDDDEFAQLVFSQPDYKDRDSREKESKKL